MSYKNSVVDITNVCYNEISSKKLMFQEREEDGNEKGKEKAFEVMAVVIFYGFWKFYSDKL